MTDRPMNPGRSLMVLLAASTLLVLTGGCIKTPVKSAMMEQAEGLVDITASALRQRLYDFTSRFAAVVETAADEIAAAEDDPRIQERALLWKLNAIPEAHRSAFKDDPFEGLFESGIFCGQMAAFFRDGAGNSLFGGHQRIAIEASERLNAEIWRLGESLTSGGDPAEARRRIGEYVAEHPIENLSFVRDPTADLYSNFDTSRRSGAGAAIGGINDAVDDLSKRLTIYAAHLPREARWQAELAASRAMRAAPVSEALRSVDSLSASHGLLARSVAGVLEQMPAERQKMVAELDELTRRRLQEIDRLRRETIAALTAEREAMVQEMEEQTELALRRIGEERRAAFEQLDRTAEKTVEQAFDRAGGLADKLFLRFAALTAVLAGIMLAAVLLFARLQRMGVSAPASR